MRRRIRRVRKGAPGNGPVATPAPRPGPTLPVRRRSSPARPAPPKHRRRRFACPVHSGPGRARRGYADDGITHVTARFGYMETPDVPGGSGRSTQPRPRDSSGSTRRPTTYRRSSCNAASRRRWRPGASGCSSPPPTSPPTQPNTSADHVTARSSSRYRARVRARRTPPVFKIGVAHVNVVQTARPNSRRPGSQVLGATAASSLESGRCSSTGATTGRFNHERIPLNYSRWSTSSNTVRARKIMRRLGALPVLLGNDGTTRRRRLFA
jgi:hypothetical protein